MRIQLAAMFLNVLKQVAVVAACSILVDSARADTQLVAPVDDAYIRAGPSAGNNYDGGGVKIGQGCPPFCDSHLESLIRFDLTSLLSGVVQNATLRLYLYDDGTWDDTGVVYVHFVTDDAWQEETVTWNTAPGPNWTAPHGSALGSAAPLVAGQGWMEFPLDAAVLEQERAGDGILSLRVVPDGLLTHYGNYYDKEHADSALRPQLQVETSGNELGLPTEIIDSTGDGSGNSLTYASSIAVDASGNVYVAGRFSDNAFKITPDDVITEIIDETGDGAFGPLDNPQGIAVDASGNTYVSGSVSDNVLKITPAGAITQIINFVGAGFGRPLDSPWGIAVDGSGNVYVAGAASDNAIKITPSGVKTEIIDEDGDGLGNTLNNPQNIAVDAMENVYVAGLFSGNVFKITPTGVITEIIDGVDWPRGLTLDGAGNVYVAGFHDDNVSKITPAGTITEIIDSSGDGVGPLIGPYQLAVDTSGRIYVCGSTSDNAFEISPYGSIREIIDATGDGASNTLGEPQGIAVDASYNVYVAGHGSHNAFRIDIDVPIDPDPFSPTFCDLFDGSLEACPCGNPGFPDTGCNIQQATGGVRLDAIVQETTPINRATLSGTGFPAASTPTAIVIRAPGLDPGAPVVFGDGLRCIGTPLVRLGADIAFVTSTHTFGHGTMAGSGTFYYQLWFRNTPIMFCDPTAAFNLSNGRSLTW